LYINDSMPQLGGDGYVLREEMAAELGMDIADTGGRGRLGG
jgi:hypothetical protein